VLDGDNCTSACQIDGAVPELEPNDDGSPSVGAGADGNDFSAANAQGPFPGDVIIAAAFQVPGDEDVFSVQNTAAAPALVRLDTFDPAIGLGLPCGSFTTGALDTVISLRNAAGALLPNGFSLAQNDERGTGDSCSGLDFTLQPGQTIFAHVLVFGDNKAFPNYLLVIDFP
jgi:hypothetical protein